MLTLQSPFVSASLTQGPPNSSFPFNVCLSSTDLSYQYQSHCGWGASQVAAVNRAALTVKLSTTRKIKTTASANKRWESQSDKNRVKHPQLMRVRDGEQCEGGQTHRSTGCGQQHGFLKGTLYTSVPGPWTLLFIASSYSYLDKGGRQIQSVCLHLPWYFLN